MAKVSPVSIKYMIHATFTAEGALEKPDIIGAIFGQTEGLLGADLEMRELQKEGKIGRIEVDLERNDKRTTGRIQIPTALDQSETTLIAAAVETIERIGPCDSQIEVERIEDVRGSKRDYIIERAKKLMVGIQGSTDSREISNQIKDSARMAGVSEYGDNKLPCGDLSEKEVIVVEGRADVLNLLKNGVKNVIGMNGTKLPDEIKQLSKEKDIILFVDGDRGGKLIAQNVVDNARVVGIVSAPDGKEVEELNGKEILMLLRKRLTPAEFFSNFSDKRRSYEIQEKQEEASSMSLNDTNKKRLREIASENANSGKAILLDRNFEKIKEVSAKSLANALDRIREKPKMIVIDGIVTNSIIMAAEDAKVDVIAAKNFASNNTKIQLVSL
ncbi:DNA primase [Candidatus Pacearchaeota archaeon]|nr:DNA primase [Candidatus Pacearchaeota archaeon]